MNNTTSIVNEPCLTETEAFRIVSVVLYAFLFFFSLLGNILVIVVVYRNKSLRNSANYFIVNMAISDLFIPILVIPRKLKVITTNDHTWGISGLTGEILCKLVYFLSDVTPMVSVLSLIFISFDRFYAVMFPLRKRRLVQRWVLISLTWLISFAVLAPHFYTFRLDKNQMYCISVWSPAFDHKKAQKNFMIFIIIAFIFVPFVILAFIYAGISKVLITQKVIGDRSASHAMRDRKRKTVVKLAFTIVLGCALCYGPYGVLLLLVAFKYDLMPPADCAWDFFMQFSFFLAYSNAVVNPAIYFLYVQNYKKELKRIISFMSRPFNNSGAGSEPQRMQMIECQQN